MIINEKLKKELVDLEKNIELVMNNNSLTEMQIETFLRNFEKSRYNVLTEIRLHNKNVEFNHEKIKTIDNEYKAELNGDILKIYVPEVMPSYKNKTHTHKRILLNIAEITKTFENLFQNEVCIYIKIYDKILGWDVDNKYIKPISDALILSKVIVDDNISKMSYYVEGGYSENPHSEIYVFDSKKISKFLEKNIL